MSGQVTDVLISFTAGQPQGKEGCLAIGKVAGGAFLWFVRGEGSGIDGVRVSYGDDAVEGNFEKIDTNLNKLQADGKPSYLWIHRGDENPIVDIKIVTSAAPVAPAGFVKVPEPVNPGQTPKEWVAYQTRAALKKIKTNDYEIGDKLDCLDGQSWRTAKVLKTRVSTSGVKEIFINFDGWAHKWDEWFVVTSRKLAPIGYHTKGRWTGATPKPKFNLTENYEAFKECAETMTAFDEKDDFKDESYAMDQNRKMVFDVLDATIDDPTIIPEIQAFMHTNLRIICKVLASESADVNQNYLDILQHVLYPKKPFYSDHGSTGSEKCVKGKYAIRNTKMPQNMPSVHWIANINYFGEHGGFDSITKRLGDMRDATQESSSETGFITAAMLVRIIAVLKDVLPDAFSKEFVGSLDLRNTLKAALRNITDKELRTLTKEALPRLIQDIERLLRLVTDEKSVAEFVEQTSLDIALRLLNSEVLEKKINGMAELARIVKSINMTKKKEVKAHGGNTSGGYSSDTEPAAGRGNANVAGGAGRRGGVSSYGSVTTHGGHGNQNQGPPVTAAQHLTPEYLTGWIEETKLVQVLLDRDQHEQIVKRSPVILKFLAQQNALTSAHIDLLWAVQEGQHEGLVRIVYETLADIAEELNEEQLDFLYERIVKKPFDQYKDYDINYVKLFTMNAVKQTRGQNKWYGLDLFWQMATSTADSGIEEDTKMRARVVLKEMLALHQFMDRRDHYIEECLGNIRKSNVVVESMHVLSQIISINEAMAEEVVMKVEKKVGLVNLILTELQAYNKAATAARDDGKQVEYRTVGDEKHAVYVGGTTHAVQVVDRLRFLFFILTTAPMLMSTEHVRSLWDTLVINAVETLDMQQCFRWLREAVDTQNNKKLAYNVFNKEVTTATFESLLCAKHVDAAGKPVEVTKEWYDCIQTYFCIVNHAQECLLSESQSWLVVTNYETLSGLASLWELSASPIAEVSTAAKHFITTVHIRLDFNFNSQEKQVIYGTFVTKCMDQLKTALAVIEEGKAGVEKATGEATEAVDLLAHFLERVESGEAMKRPLFYAGESVRGHWKSTRPNKYAATVKEVNPDGTYKVLYEDGDFDAKCPETNLFTQDDLKKEIVQVDGGNDHTYPRVMLSGSKEYFDLFFSLLGLGGALAHRVWKLLSNLPTNEAMRIKVRELVGATEVDWRTVLPVDSMTKLLYTLQIVQDNVIDEEDEAEDVAPLNVSTIEGDEGVEPPLGEMPDKSVSLARQTSSEISPKKQNWCKMFVSTGGFMHMYKSIFMSADMKHVFEGELPVQCFNLILKLVNHFLIGNVSTIGVEGTQIMALIDPKAFVARLLVTLEQSVASHKAIEGESDNNVQKRLADMVNNILSTLGAILTVQPGIMACVFEFASWEPLLTNGMLKNENAHIRKDLAQGIVSFCSSFDDAKKYGDRLPRGFFQPILLKLLNNADTSDGSVFCTELIVGLESLLKSSRDGLGVDPASIGDALTKLLISHPFLEVTEKDYDPVLCSLMSLTEQVVRKAPALKALLGTGSDSKTQEGSLLEDVTKSLFELPDTTFSGTSGSAPPPPKCKSVLARQSAFALLAELCKDNEANSQFVVARVQGNHVTVVHEGQKSRDWKEWKFSPESKDDMGREGFVGLKNLGCICYMNASMQQLFMIPKLRHNILSIDRYDDPDLSKSMIYQLQHIMGHLQESSKQYINPKPFTDIWTDEFGQPINVGKQEDASGFVSRILDDLHEKTKGTPYNHVVEEVMGGRLAAQLYGKNECKHFKQRVEDFKMINIEIKNKKTILEGLEAFIGTETLDGGNQFKCEKCGKKVDTIRRSCINRLPSTLCIALKRFKMNFDTFMPEKVNSRVEFPMDLNMKPYTQEAITSGAQYKMLKQNELEAQSANESKGGDAPAEGKGADKEADEGEEAAAAKPEAEEDLEALIPVHPDEYYQYRLKGIVVHTGTAHGGHYYSFIQERLVAGQEGAEEQEGQWYKFNDNVVTPWNIENLEDECFGGSKKQWGGMANGYLLFYDRVPMPKTVAPDAMGGAVSFETAATVAKVANKLIKKRTAMRARVRLPPKIFGEIWEQNLNYWRNRNVFDNNYFEFLWVLCNNKNVINAEDKTPVGSVSLTTPSSLKDNFARLATMFFMITLARAANKQSMPQWVGLLKKLYTNNAATSAWFLNLMSIEKLNYPFVYLFSCPEGYIRVAIADLMCMALSNVAPSEQASFATVRQRGESVSQAPDAIEAKGEEKASQAVVAPNEGTVRVEDRGYCVGFVDQMLANFHVAPFHYRTFNEYFRVFSHFVQLGSAETQYMSTSNLVPRLVDMYLGPRSTHPELSGAVSTVTGKRTTMDNPDLTNVFGLLTELTKTGLANLNDLSQEMLTCKPFLKYFLMEGTFHRVGAQVNGLVKRIADENKELSTLIVSLIMEGMKINSYAQVRPYFRVLMSFLTYTDSLAEWRTELIMTELLATMQSQQNFWKMTDFCIDHVIRMSKKSQVVATWLHAHADELDWMIKWLQAHPSPPTDNKDPAMLAFRKRAKAGSETLLYTEEGFTYTQSSVYSAYNLTIVQKQAVLDLLKNGNVSGLGNEACSDSDKERNERKYDKGDMIDCLDTEIKWLNAEVKDISANGLMVLVGYTNFDPKWDEWIHVSSPRLATKGRFSSLEPRGKK